MEPNETIKLIKPKKPRQPTVKQKAFVKAFIETSNASEAVRQSYPNVKAVGAVASENLQKPIIQSMIEDMKANYLTDSYEAYNIQKSILRQSAQFPKTHELANKIADKIQDRAGFAPTKKSEQKNLTAKFVITRGDLPRDDTNINSTTNASHIASIDPTEPNDPIRQRGGGGGE